MVPSDELLLLLGSTSTLNGFITCAAHNKAVVVGMISKDKVKLKLTALAHIFMDIVCLTPPFFHKIRCITQLATRCVSTLNPLNSQLTCLYFFFFKILR